jgi:hypothetical protein
LGDGDQGLSSGDPESAKTLERMREMKISTIQKSRKQKELLDTLLTELSDECQRTVNLLAKLQRKRNGRNHRTEVLADLSASIEHLRVHTKGLPELIDQEFDRDTED